MCVRACVSEYVSLAHRVKQHQHLPDFLLFLVISFELIVLLLFYCFEFAEICLTLDFNVIRCDDLLSNRTFDVRMSSSGENSNRKIVAMQ